MPIFAMYPRCSFMGKKRLVCHSIQFNVHAVPPLMYILVFLFMFGCNFDCISHNSPDLGLMAAWIAAVIIPIVFFFTLIYLCCCTILVRNGEAVIIERLGRFHRILRPGFNCLVPLVDSPRVFPWQHTCVNARTGELMDTTEASIRIDQRESIFHFAPMEVYTRDTLLLEVDAVMYYRLSDVFKACYEIDDLQNALMAAAQTQIKEAFGHMTFHEALECQSFINEYLVREFGALFEKWGVQVFRMEMISLKPGRGDKATTEAMKQNMIAERKRRGDFIKSEATKASQNIVADGQKRVAQILGLAEQESTKKESEGSAASTILLAQAEQSSLDAISQVTLKEGTGLSEFFLTKRYIDFIGYVLRGGNKKTLLLPYEPSMFSGTLFKSAAKAFGKKGGKGKVDVAKKERFAELD